MARLLGQGIGADAAEVWLMGGERPALAARWPAAADEPSAPIATVRDLAADGWRALPVREGAETLGVLRVRTQEHRPISAVEERLFTGLAAQAGLVLRSARLRSELSGRLVELSARAAELQLSRERLIETQDDERRRLERDIHDGAQQSLVALAVNLRRAENLLGKSPQRAADVLAEQAEAAQHAIATLTSLARGIYPVALAEQGLVCALAAVARASALPVELTADESIELPPAVAAALYFASLEALQNAAKHSGATRVRICLGQDAGGVCLSVSDDGVGLRSAGLREGAGMTNMRDRIDAAGGTLTVRDADGTGVRVEMRVPLGAGRSGAT
jgi:signal transduction histidine kinase